MVALLGVLLLKIEIFLLLGTAANCQRSTS